MPQGRLCATPQAASVSLFAVAHSPNSAVPVFADEKSAVFGNRDSHWAAPDFTLGGNKAGHEILVFTTRVAGRMIEWDAHDLVTGAFYLIPRPVKGNQHVAFARGAELGAGGGRP